MTGSKSQLSLTSRRASHTRLTLAVSALLLALSPLAAQQSSTSAQSQSAHVVAEHDPQPVGDHGPVLSSSEIAQGAILLHFTHADGGLRLKGRGREAFQIAGADHIWFPADAHLVNGVVVVSTSLVQQPTAVRYTWQVPSAAVLFNGAGVPAAPFRTDK